MKRYTHTLFRCPVCGTETYVEARTFSFLHLFATLFTGGLWIIAWVIIELTKEKPTCISCGRAQHQARLLAIHRSKAYELELGRFVQKFERIQETLESLTEKQVAEIEAKDLTGIFRCNNFDFDLPTDGCLREVECHMNKIRLEVDSMLDRLELALGYRP